LTDGLLSQDHEELCERVSYLEKKVHQQEDEIVCLKSAMADVIRRLGQAEAGRGTIIYISLIIIGCHTYNNISHMKKM